MSRETGRGGWFGTEEQEKAQERVQVELLYKEFEDQVMDRIQKFFNGKLSENERAQVREYIGSFDASSSEFIANENSRVLTRNLEAVFAHYGFDDDSSFVLEEQFGDFYTRKKEELDPDHEEYFDEETHAELSLKELVARIRTVFFLKVQSGRSEDAVLQELDAEFLSTIRKDLAVAYDADDPQMQRVLGELAVVEPTGAKNKDEGGRLSEGSMREFVDGLPSRLGAEAERNVIQSLGFNKAAIANARRIAKAVEEESRTYMQGVREEIQGMREQGVFDAEEKESAERMHAYLEQSEQGVAIILHKILELEKLPSFRKDLENLE